MPTPSPQLHQLFKPQDCECADLARAEPEPDLVGVSAREALPFGQLGHPEGEQPIAMQIGCDLRVVDIHSSPAQQLRERLVCPLVVVYPLDLHSNGPHFRYIKHGLAESDVISIYMPSQLSYLTAGAFLARGVV